MGRTPDSDCVLLAPPRSIIGTISIVKGKIAVWPLNPPPATEKGRQINL
jgi:hypothetical protein